MASDDGIWVAAAATTTDCTAAIDGKPIVRPNCEGGKEAEEREKIFKDFIPQSRRTDNYENWVGSAIAIVISPGQENKSI